MNIYIIRLREQMLVDYVSCVFQMIVRILKFIISREGVEVNGIWDDELSDIVGVVGDYIINIEESRNHEVEDWVHVRMS